MPASYPFRFFGRAPLVTLPADDRVLGYELRFVSDPSRAVRDQVAELWERAVFASQQIGKSEDAWRWVRGWTRLEVTPRFPDNLTSLFDELADIFVAIHGVAPLADVIFASRIAGWPKRLHPWDEYSKRRGDPPGPPFASYRRLGLPGENASPPRDETDLHFERARLVHRVAAKIPKPKPKPDDKADATPSTKPPGTRFKPKDRVLAFSDGWYDGHIVSAMPENEWRVHFAGYDSANDTNVADRLVIPYPTGEPMQLTVGARVVVESERGWYDAVVLKVISQTRWRVHYAGWPESSDEDVTVGRVAAR